MTKEFPIPAKLNIALVLSIQMDKVQHSLLMSVGKLLLLNKKQKYRDLKTKERLSVIIYNADTCKRILQKKYTFLCLL